MIDVATVPSTFDWSEFVGIRIARAGGREWRRSASEDEAEFIARIRAEALKAGAHTIFCRGWIQV
jgi:hypothetical protein